VTQSQFSPADEWTMTQRSVSAKKHRTL